MPIDEVGEYEEERIVERVPSSRFSNRVKEQVPNNVRFETHLDPQ